MGLSDFEDVDPNVLASLKMEPARVKGLTNQKDLGLQTFGVDLMTSTCISKSCAVLV